VLYSTCWLAAAAKDRRNLGLETALIHATDPEAFSYTAHNSLPSFVITQVCERCFQPSKYPYC